MRKTKLIQQALINLIIERFDDLEEETGANFTHTKRIILRLARKLKIFED